MSRWWRWTAARSASCTAFRTTFRSTPRRYAGSGLRSSRWRSIASMARGGAATSQTMPRRRSRCPSGGISRRSPARSTPRRSHLYGLLHPSHRWQYDCQTRNGESTMSSPPLVLLGAPGSPYTRKMLAALRYRRIPYRLLVGSHRTPTDLPKPKPQLLPTFYFTGDDGSVEAVVDSTPLLRRFERDYPERKLVPSDPAIAFLDYLL